MGVNTRSVICISYEVPPSGRASALLDGGCGQIINLEGHSTEMQIPQPVAFNLETIASQLPVGTWLTRQLFQELQRIGPGPWEGETPNTSPLIPALLGAGLIEIDSNYFYFRVLPQGVASPDKLGSVSASPASSGDVSPERS